MSIEINDLCVYAQQQTLVDNLSLQVNKGEVLALLGASGSGKSLTCLATLDVLPSSLQKKGQVLVDGKVWDAQTMRGKAVACIMQNPSSAFNPVYTMYQHAQETLKSSGAKVSDAAIYQAMQEAGLKEFDAVLALYPFQMSGGMLQRMMLALALMTPADYLIADEPTTDLDLVVQSYILEQLKQIQHKRGLGVLLITHDLGVVAKMADRVAVMSQGVIVEQASVQALFSQPQHEVSQRLLDAHLAMYQIQESSA